ncbi:MAG: hypothetical protein JRN23_04775 [Nitrososphaerota archaeon]|nr:hypothetical protein [Nitrososphaerota archaeon]MDG7022235.1 hypothetical protein [Nitrososphaerota archaeon]
MGLDSSFAAPGAAAVNGWAERAGADFRFAFEGPKPVTRVLKLGDGALLARRPSERLAP